MSEIPDLIKNKLKSAEERFVLRTDKKVIICLSLKELRQKLTLIKTLSTITNKPYFIAYRIDKGEGKSKTISFGSFSSLDENKIIHSIKIILRGFTQVSKQFMEE